MPTKKREPFINRMLAPVPVEDFLRAHTVVTQSRWRDPHAEPSMERTIGILSRLFPDKQSGVVPAMMFRMQALMSLADHPKMQAWRIEGEHDGALLFREPVFKAAAVCPIKQTKKDITFEPDSFFAKVLEFSAQEGDA